jgi:predicted transglutaminase-like protease
MMDGQYALLDLKTPLAGSRTWFAQIAAYKRAAIENGYKVDNAGTIQADPNGGTARVKWLSDTKENELMAFNAFLGALNAHRYFKAK